MSFSLCCRINYEYVEGNVIDLPPYVLEQNQNKDFPFFFRLSTETEIETYLGVREFTSDNDEFLISYHLADLLGLEENQIVDFFLLENVLKGKFIKLEPLNKEFFDIENYDEVLEQKLSKYPILYQNQIISLDIFDNNYRFKVLNIEHDWKNIDLENDLFELDCINIINSDIEVDIYNRFMEEEYYENLKKQAMERENEEKELTFMKEQDINILKIGNRLGGSCNLKTNDEIRMARLKKFHKK